MAKPRKNITGFGSTSSVHEARFRKDRAAAADFLAGAKRALNRSRCDSLRSNLRLAANTIGQAVAECRAFPSKPKKRKTGCRTAIAKLNTTYYRLLTAAQAHTCAKRGR